MNDQPLPGPDAGPARLPSSIAAAWGLRDRPGKGPRRGLSLPQIVRAGLTVAAADGLAAVSMSRVATELGVGTMSLYRYVESKRELLELMVDTALGPPPDADPDASWRQGLSRWAWSQVARYRDSLWVVEVPLTGPPAYPNALGWLERALYYMRETGLDESQKMSVILLLSNYVRVQAVMEAQLDSAIRAAGISGAEAMAGYGQLLRLLLDEHRFPHLMAVADAGVMDKADPWEDEFTFGLERLLDGVDVLVRGVASKD
jgi:AcrR family transcriptional regulator